jgi:hypothetical protein
LVPLPKALESARFRPEERGQCCCARLEEGDILFFEKTRFEFLAGKIAFLLSQQQSDAAYHKKIAYCPAQDRLYERRGEMAFSHTLFAAPQTREPAVSPPHPSVS